MAVSAAQQDICEGMRGDGERFPEKINAGLDPYLGDGKQHIFKHIKIYTYISHYFPIMVGYYKLDPHETRWLCLKMGCPLFH